MSDQAYALAAVFRAFGINAQVLPPADHRTLELGRKFSSGRECFPFIITCGDILKKVSEPDFNPQTCVFLMPSANGPCRFGQYHKMHHVILKTLGYEDVRLMSPNSKYSYTNILNSQFHYRAWLAILAVEVIEKLTREIRPYELKPGTTDEIYQHSLQLICQTLENNEKSLKPVLNEIKNLFSEIPIKREPRRPIIGIVGEVFIRSNSFSNNHLIRKIENLGGEVWVAPFSEWLFYTNHRFKEDSWRKKDYLAFLKILLQDRIQRNREHKLFAPFRHLIRNHQEPETNWLLKLSAPYIHSSFGGEAILSVGKAIDYIQKGLAGIINVMPFTCMYGNTVTAISKKLKEDFNNFPWLNIAFDGQEDTSLLTHLEAFMHQAQQYQQHYSLQEVSY